MKKAIPVFIALALIGLVVFINFGNKIYQKYSYGSETADLNDYFGIYKSSDVPMVLQDTRVEEAATMIDGKVYFDIETVEKYFTERFYLDTNENLLLYTTSTGTYKTEPGTKSYYSADEVFDEKYTLSLIQDDTLYIALDYLKKYVNFSYELFDDPLRIQVYTEWGQYTCADLKSDTQVRWRGGVKSEILREISEGETVEILEEMDEWTKVKTNDAFIGYVENFRLTNERIDYEIPVTDVKEEEFSSSVRDHKINLSWDYMEWPQDGSSLRNTVNYAKELNVISPTWYYLTDNEGSFKSLGNADYVNTAHKMDIEVWPLISNFHAGIDVDTTEVLSYTSKREQLIANLIEDVVNYGADGINVDFENLASSCGPSFVQFIRELALECHKANLVLSVDNYVPTEYTAFYNRGAQSQFCDYIVIMGYDEHYAGSEAGSVASLSWVREGIEKTLKYVPAEKVINAIPFYTRVWKTKDGQVTSEAVNMDVGLDFISRNKITTKWLDDCGQNYGEATFDGIYYQVWLEDVESITAKINVMTANKIAGIASWRIGQEIPEVWSVIEAYMQQP